MNPIPDLIDNRKHQLAQVLRDLLAGAQEPTLDVVTAFFNLMGLEVLSPTIEQVTQLRLLLGKEQQQEFVVGERLLAELEDAVARGETTAQAIKRWRDFLAQARVEVRRYLKAFCHGKAYLVRGVPILESVGIIGSSNFTGAGLTTNLELNAVLKQASAVEELKKWFECLWTESEDYKSKLLELLEHFTRTYTPYEIYIKVLYEAMQDKLGEDLGEKEGKPSPIALADFQHEGYLAAKEILENYAGVLIADSVGLGKTYLALRLLDDYAYRERQTALIICPAAIQDTVWQPLLGRFAIPHEIISMERLSQKDFPVDAYARRFRVIVVDESHNFRNPNTNRWPNLFRLITQGDLDKKVILLTATPVNNTVFDLYHQLRFLTRDDRRRLLVAGIPDLWEYFRRAEQNKEALYEVLEALAVRRSRPFIRTNYPEAEIDGQKIRFPERELHTVSYSLKKSYGGDLYRRIATAIESLFLAPYQVDTYRKELEARKRWVRQLSLFEKPEEEESAVERLQKALGWSKEQSHEFLMTVGRQAALAHIMRVLYLKRLESSVEALKISLNRLQHFLKTFLRALEQGRILSSGEFRRWQQIEASDESGDEETDEGAFFASLPEISAEIYDLEHLRQAVEADLHALESIIGELNSIQVDEKLETLRHLLSSPELQGKKVVVFSYFKDTARYIYSHLVSENRRIAIVDSAVKPAERSERILRFAPRANGQPDLPEDRQFDLLISTDVLSEGQNLQDAEVIINYDLHWNPMRIVQRIGRLDRLGSPHELIHVYNFFPEEELEELLGLLGRLYEKLNAVNRTVGLDASVLGEMPNPLDFNTLRRIAREDEETLRELEAESELTVGEFLKQDLLRFLKELGEEHLQSIPSGVGTARKSADGSRGFFAAFRNPVTNQHHWLFYDEQKERMLEQRLEAIRPIRCEPSEEPEPLPEDFNPRPLIVKLRRHVWDRIRSAEKGPKTLPSPQNQVVNWLRATPPSAERNRLLQYFETRPLTGPDLKELRRLWRERSAQPPEKWLQPLLTFAESHPHPSSTPSEGSGVLAPTSEEDLECIAWIKVL